MKTAWGLVLLGLLSGLVSLVTSAPAGWLLARLDLPPAISGLALHGASGELCAGSGELMLRQRRLGRLEWRCGLGSLQSLLHGRLGLETRLMISPAADLTGQLVLGAGDRQSLVGLAGRVRVSELPFALPEASGDLVIEGLELELVAGRPAAGQGRVNWRDAALAGLDLGELRVELSTYDQTLRARLSGSGGEVAVDGSAELGPDGRYRLELAVTSLHGALPEGLDRLAGPLRREGEDRASLSLSGRL